MKRDELDNLFINLRGEFDCEEPNDGHTSRFKDRLSGLNYDNTKSPTKLRTLWISLASVAAVLLLFFGIGTFNNENDELVELASVSEEMAETQGFFTLAINQELEKIESKRSPQTQKLIEDAMTQLDILEKDYKDLQIDLKESGDDQRVIFAMISNFQNRVDLLQNVLEHINQINNFKNNSNENTNTI